MKKLLTLLLIIAFTSVTAQIRVSESDDVDFTKYKTLNFAGWQKDSDKALSEFDQKRLLDAFKDEFQSLAQR